MAAAVLALALLFCSCNSKSFDAKEIAVDFSRGFQADVEGSINGLSFTAQLQKDVQGVYSMVISEPDSLKGAELVLGGETVQANYAGLTMEIDAGAMPASAVLTTVRNVFDKVGGMAYAEGTMKDNLMVLEGESLSGNYILMLDRASGVVKSLEIAENSLQITFTGFVYS